MVTTVSDIAAVEPYLSRGQKDLMEAVLLKRIPSCGKQADFYIAYHDVIKKYVEKMNDVTDIVNSAEINGQGNLITGTIAVNTVATKSTAAEKFFERKWIYGGIRFAHLHQGDRILAFKDQAQWKSFCRDIQTQIATKISSASSISLEDLQGVSHAAMGL